LSAAVSATVAARTERVIETMLLYKLLKVFPALLLVAALSGPAVLIAPIQAEGPPNSEQPRADKPRPRQDLYGDPLPPDAIARMGSIRWRHVDDDRSFIHVIPSPDGKLVATVSSSTSALGLPTQGTVRVWDLTDGRQLCMFPWDDTALPWNMRFTEDGSRLMVPTARGVVRFHDTRTGKLKAETKPVLDNEQAVHVLTEEGRWVVSNRGPRDKPDLTLTAVASDPAARPRQVKLDPVPGDFDFHSTKFMVAGETLISFRCAAPPDGRPVILRWDVRSGKLTKKTTLNASGMAMKFLPMVMQFSRDGRRVTTARPSDVLQVWDTETGAEVVKLEEAYRWGDSIHISPDGKRIIAGRPIKPGADGIVVATVWELEHGKIIARLPTARWSTSFHLLPDGKTFLGASGSGMMFGTWDIATGRRVGAAVGHECPLLHLAFAPDGKTLLTASADAEEPVLAWDAATGKKRQELAAPHGERESWWLRYSEPFVLTPGGAVVSTGKGTLTWTDLKTGRELRRVAPGPIATAREADDQFQVERVSLTLDPKTRRPAVFGLHTFGPSPWVPSEKVWKEVVTLHDAESGELLAHRTYARDRSGSTGRISPDGRLLARASPDSSASVELEPVFGGGGSFELGQPRCYDYLFTPDGQTLITVTGKWSAEKPAGRPAATFTIHLWEIRSGGQRLAFTVPFQPSPLATSPDGRFLAAGRAGDKTICVWDLATGAAVAKRDGTLAAVRALAFRPDGQALASGHADGTALVWDLSGLPGVKRAAADRDAAWKDLASDDAGKAYRAILSLAADPEVAAFLRQRVKPAPALPARRIQEWVQALDDNEFTTREAATAALIRVGDMAEADLRAALRGQLSPEQRRRIENVLAKPRGPESDPERLRVLRCVEVLERAGSEHIAASGAEATGRAAVALLEELAAGASPARLTQEAKSSLDRLKTRADVRH
jgi:WD40 repeat protein